MKLGKNKKQKTDQIIRIEELEALMQKYRQHVYAS